MKTVLRKDQHGYTYGFNVPDDDSTEYEDHVVCQPYYWLPKGRMHPIAMQPANPPFIPRVLNCEVFDFYEVQTSFLMPAILEVGDRGFLFAEIVDFEGKRSFAVDGRFVIPEDWSKEQFFEKLLVYLHTDYANSDDFLGMYFRPSVDEDVWDFFAKTNGEMVKIGQFPKGYETPMVGFLERCFLEPFS